MHGGHGGAVVSAPGTGSLCAKVCAPPPGGKVGVEELARPDLEPHCSARSTSVPDLTCAPVDE